MWLWQNFEKWIQLATFQHFFLILQIKNLDAIEGYETEVYLWRVELLNVQEKVLNLCFIMIRCFVMFLRGGKVNVVKYWWSIVVKLKVDKWLLSKWLSKTKNQTWYQDSYFAISVTLLSL